MKKRVFGMLLAVAMVLSVLTVGVSAEASAAEGYYLASETCYVDGAFSYSNTYTYDTDANLTKTVYKKSDGTTSTHTYSYDSNGNLTKEVEGSTYTLTYEYDSDGNLTKEVYKETSGYSYTYTYTYDSDGNLTKEICSYSDSSTVTYTYTYNSSGYLTQRVGKDSSGSTTSTITYDYYSSGNLKKVYCKISSRSSYTDTYSYDSNGNVTQQVHKSTIGSYTSSTTYTYSYDSMGNLTKQTVGSSTTYYTNTYDSNGNLVKVVATSGSTTTTYTYTYYSLAEIQSPFTDVKDETKWYFDAVIWAVNDGITAGTSDTTFSPNMDCSRAQIVTFLWRAAGSPEPTTTKNPFTDVKKSAYYYKAVLWAVENGITAGTSSTTFSPDKSCTRAEAVTFLYRYEGSPSVSTTSKFTDVGSTWYTNAVAWAVKNGITAGTTKTTFSPNTTCSRAMIVTFLYRDLAD